MGSSQYDVKATEEQSSSVKFSETQPRAWKVYAQGASFTSVSAPAKTDDGCYVCQNEAGQHCTIVGGFIAYEI